ncbi:unnamed protein product [Trichobilharzia szidati]|nr:unnamed protein product [Trichobilharzia szidati]
MDSSLLCETSTADPNSAYDELPMPYRMLDKILQEILDDIWATIELKEHHKDKAFSLKQLKRQELDKSLNSVEGVHLYCIVGEYLFKIYENQISVYNVDSLQFISEWMYTNETSGYSSIRTFKTIELNKNIIFQVLIDDSGQTTMLMFVEGLFIPVKPISSSSSSSSAENQPYHALNGKISPCGQFYVSLNEDSVNSKVWLEVYRLPVDSWMKEVSPIIQEFQNARTANLDDEVAPIKEMTVNLNERKAYYESHLQLSSPILAGRIRYPNLPSGPACKSISAALKQANEKTGLLNYSNFATHLYTDAISEASQLAFIEHRKYPSCLINPPKAQVVETEEEGANVITTQGAVNSLELAKPVNEPPTETNSPVQTKRQLRNAKSSKRKAAGKDNSVTTIQQPTGGGTGGSRKKKGDKNQSTSEIVEPVANKESDSISNNNNENNNNKKHENEQAIETVIKTLTLEETEQVDEDINRTQQFEEIRKQLVSELNETRPKSYPYFEFLPVNLNTDSRNQETSSSSKIVGSSSSICVYWSGSCQLFFYFLDKFTKAGEGVPEEVAYFGSCITHISIKPFIMNSVNTAGSREQSSNRSNLINSENYYLLVGLQSGIVVIKQLQSNRYLPIVQTSLGPIVDVGLKSDTNSITLITACCLNKKGSIHSEMEESLKLYNKYTFDIYNLEKSQFDWKRANAMRLDNFRCRAITVLNTDDNFTIIVCLMSTKDLLIFPVNSTLHDNQEDKLNQSLDECINENRPFQQADTSTNVRLLQNTIHISLPNPYEINLNTGTVSLFPEMNEKWIDNMELFNQLSLTSIQRISDTDIYDDGNTGRVMNDEGEKDTLNAYHLWIRGKKKDEDKIHTKLFRTTLKFAQSESLDRPFEMNIEEANEDVYCEPIQIHSNKLLQSR